MPVSKSLSYLSTEGVVYIAWRFALSVHFVKVGAIRKHKL